MVGRSTVPGSRSTRRSSKRQASGSKDQAQDHSCLYFESFLTGKIKLYIHKRCVWVPQKLKEKLSCWRDYPSFRSAINSLQTAEVCLKGRKGERLCLIQKISMQGLSLHLLFWENPRSQSKHLMVEDMFA